MDSIYLDSAATTAVDPGVLAAMLPWFQADFGNPSSIHATGRRARGAVDEARDAVAQLIGSAYSEITFTSGGTEADNLAILGVLLAAPPERNHVVISAIEHHAVLHAGRLARQLGFRVTEVAPDTNGVLAADRVAAALDAGTALVSVMHGNNEIGTLQPIAQIADVAHAIGAWLHTDAVQSAAVQPVDVDELRCDLLSLSAHKMHGPKGAGALYVRTGVPVSALMVGGAQERERRAGTENVPAIVGFGVAANQTRRWVRTDGPATVGTLRDGVETAIQSALPGVTIHGADAARMPHISSFRLDGVDGATLLMNLDRRGIAASSGSACSSGSIEPSHVLTALGIHRRDASGGVRLSLSRTTSAEELTAAVQAVCEISAQLQR
ncbi:MAG: cysteine desulfurase [Armatimonadetes bacterium]|nr:cysteine desulfurase [Armatimonadota bacterium]MDE2205225.1 cysteine desulfurase [Armatimonadota bacterium]